MQININDIYAQRITAINDRGVEISAKKYFLDLWNYDFCDSNYYKPMMLSCIKRLKKLN